MGKNSPQGGGSLERENYEKEGTKLDGGQGPKKYLEGLDEKNTYGKGDGRGVECEPDWGRWCRGM